MPKYNLDDKKSASDHAKASVFTPPVVTASAATATTGNSASAAAPKAAAIAEIVSVAQEEKFRSVTMKGKIKPPLRFTPVATVPAPQAVYIKAFDEIFSQIQNEAERTTILTNIEAIIAKGLICFIDFTGESVEENAVKLTTAVLGENSHTVQCIQKQRAEFFGLPDFKQHCEKNALETVYIGGVFGDACVWNAAGKMAENIYSKRLGYTHSNIRFINTEHPFRFKHAVIWPNITEGYFENHETFPQFFHFSQTVAFHVNMGDEDIDEDEKEALIARKPVATGRSYQYFSATEKQYSRLHHKVWRAGSLPTNLFAFFKPSQIGVEVTAAGQATALMATAGHQEKFRSTSMNGKIKPNLRFMPVTTIPQAQAVYIKAFDEIFSQIPNEAESLALLRNIEAIIAKGCICFIDFTGESVEEEAVKLTAAILGEHSHTVKCIQKQRTEFFGLSDFKNYCEKNALRTVYIGGVFGDASVWNAAGKMAENIYAKRLGYTHPNIRFINKEHPFRFKHAVICPDITEGYFENDEIFPQFFHFPQKAAFCVNMGDEDIDENEKEALIARKPVATGDSYQYFSDTEKRFSRLHHKVCRVAYARIEEDKAKTGNSLSKG